MSAEKNGLIVLLGEEDLEVRIYLETALRCQGYSVEGAQSGEEVRVYLQRQPAHISAAVLDMTMPGRDATLNEIRRLDPNIFEWSLA